MFDPDVDIDSLGLNFTYTEAPVAPKPKAAAKIKTAEVLVELEDKRTNEDIRAEALTFVSNALDLPDDVIAGSRRLLTMATGELRDFIMEAVVPIVLAVNPAMESVRQMVPRIFDNGEETEVELPVEQLASFAQGTAILATKLKIIDMLGLSQEVRERLLTRMIPQQPTPAQPPEKR